MDVAFFRSDCEVRVFNGSSKPIGEALDRVYAGMSMSGDANPRRTRRISSTGIHAVKDVLVRSSPDEKP